MIDGPRLMRWVLGYEKAYLVHREGAVYNRQGRVMTARVDRYGYLAVRLNANGRQAWKRVHRLVCEAWHGPAPEGAHAAHLDGNRLNNQPSNLAWKTPAENNADKLRHGTHQAGSKHPRVKLTGEQVEAIRLSPLASRAASRAFGVSQSQIVRIRNRTRWAEGIAQTPSSTDSSS